MRRSWTNDAWDKKFDSEIKNKKTARWNRKDTSGSGHESSTTAARSSVARKFNVVKCGKGFGRRYDENDKLDYDYDDRGDLIVRERDDNE